MSSALLTAHYLTARLMWRARRDSNPCAQGRCATRLRYAPSSKTIHSTQAKGEINPEIVQTAPSRALREDRQRRQSRLELLERETAVAHAALRLSIELAECAAERSVEKQRVVAEAVGAAGSESDAARTFGAKKPFQIGRASCRERV